MIRVTEEHFITVFENDFQFNSYGKYNHRHDEINKYSASGVLTLVLLSNLRNRDKQLFHVVFVEWERIQMSKDTPVNKMTNETNQLCRFLICNFINSFLNFRLSYIRCSCQQRKLRFRIFSWLQLQFIVIFHVLFS
jgi:hypothetical protein